jgi:hypothetical protein
MHERMTPRSRTRWSLAVAVALAAHALAMIAMLRAPPPAIPRAQPSETEVELEAPAVAPAATEAATAEPPPSPAAPIARVASRSVGRDLQAGPAPSSTPEAHAAPQPSASTAAAPTTADEGWSFSAAPQGGHGGGTAGALGRATSAGVGAVIAEAERKAAARERKPKIFTPDEWELGLVPGGQYAAFTRDRVRNSLAPMNGHALLEFWTDRRGLVARVRVLDASSDRRAWDDVADALALDAHAAYPLKIPDDADGLIITLDVTSVLKTISGASPTASTFGKIVGAITDPLDTLADSKAPPQRLVTARIVGVRAF